MSSSFDLNDHHQDETTRNDTTSVIVVNEDDDDAVASTSLAAADDDDPAHTFSSSLGDHLEYPNNHRIVECPDDLVDKQSSATSDKLPIGEANTSPTAKEEGVLLMDTSNMGEPKQHVSHKQIVEESPVPGAFHVAVPPTSPREPNGQQEQDKKVPDRINSQEMQILNKTRRMVVAGQDYSEKVQEKVSVQEMRILNKMRGTDGLAPSAPAAEPAMSQPTPREPVVVRDGMQLLQDVPMTIAPVPPALAQAQHYVRAGAFSMPGINGALVSDASIEIGGGGGEGEPPNELQTPEARRRQTLWMSLVEAVMVQPHPTNLETAEPVEEVEGSDVDIVRRRKDAWVQRQRLFLLALLILVLLVVGISVGVSTGKQPKAEDDNQSEAVWTNVTTVAPSSYAVDFLPNTTIVAIESDPNSAQAKAYQWLLQDPNLAITSNERLLQRFALATFFYASGGPGWSTKNGSDASFHSHATNECNWFANIVGNLAQLHIGCECNIGNTTNGTATATTTEERLPIAEELFFPNFNLVGYLPNELALLTDLEYLTFADNYLQGHLPPVLFEKVTGLIELDLLKNDLSGSIPSEVGLLSDLERLIVRSNKLEGTLPTELGQLSSVVILEVAFNNDISGTIPSQLGSLPKLEALHLEATSLGGTLPEVICDLKDRGRLERIHVNCSQVACNCCECGRRLFGGPDNPGRPRGKPGILPCGADPHPHHPPMRPQPH